MLSALLSSYCHLAPTPGPGALRQQVGHLGFCSLQDLQTQSWAQSGPSGTMDVELGEMGTGQASWKPEEETLEWFTGFCIQVSRMQPLGSQREVTTNNQ